MIVLPVVVQAASAGLAARDARRLAPQQAISRVNFRAGLIVMEVVLPSEGISTPSSELDEVTRKPERKTIVQPRKAEQPYAQLAVGLVVPCRVYYPTTLGW